MLDGLSLEQSPGVRVVELGPGTGAVTGEIVRRLPDEASCLAIDVDPVFSTRVGARWPRIVSVCDRAERLAEIAGARDLLPVDHIVSGLPFASLPVSSARAIVDAIVSSLRVGGTFTTFQYVHAYGFSSAVTRPSDPDAGNGIVASPHARPRQSAPGIGAPLAQAQIGRAP